MILLLVGLFLGSIPSFAVAASPKPKINCLIINLEYVNCTWSEPELKNNYSFKSRFVHDEPLDCPAYHRINGVNVGCKFPYGISQRFLTLNTWLYSENGSLVTEQSYLLKEYVKLSPPSNLSVLARKNAELWLYWNITNPGNKDCIESEVRHRTDNNDWKNPNRATRTSFSLPFPSRKQYEFQVRARIAYSCGESKYWSDWSESVCWGSSNNSTEINCLIINLEYVNCTWSEPELKNNYSFKSRFVHDEPLDCPAYHRINGVNVGCKFPYGISQRFLTLNTWLYSENGSLVTEQSDLLKEYVKLSPPSNLSVLARKNAELWLYWNITNPGNKDCIESEVRHRTDNNDWKNPNRATRTSFSLPFPSRKQYEFQVRARIAYSCGESKYWSDWSESVCWGSSNNSTEINCLIINLEYVNCTWSEPELKNNYSFKSRFVHDEPLDCPAYHRINGVNVGCKFPYGISQRFLTLNTWLYSENGSLVTEQSDLLKEYVKLSPPSNLSVLARKNAELWLYWNITNPGNKDCIESEVRHRTDNNDWKNPNRATRTSFSLPFPSRKQYEFQVRARIAYSCGESKYWSDWSESVCWGSSNNSTEINCLIINLEYVNCTWSEPELKNNYSFKSRFVHDEPLDCPAYHRINGVNVGCKFPYGISQRFLTLNTWLYSENGSLVTEQSDLLKEYVKLSPPSNLSVLARKNAELWLYWNITNPGNKDCIESEVRHRTDNNDWKNPNRATRTSFSLPFPSRKQYEFQVRARIAYSCGESKYWSDWSESVCWGSSNNSTVSQGSISVASLLLYTFGATILLVILSCLLVHSERLRIILIPVVPNAGRNVGQYLTSLFDNYDDGNIEKWLSMPKDLENGFKPNFTERACPVREYRMMSQSSSDSESILSNPTEQSSDYQCMHSYSSASTIPGPAEDLPTQDPLPVDNPV